MRNKIRNYLRGVGSVVDILPSRSRSSKARRKRAAQHFMRMKAVIDGKVVTMSVSYSDYPKASPQATIGALQSDWQKVGNDIGSAFNKVAVVDACDFQNG